MEGSRNHWRDVRVVYCACLESMCAKSTPGSNPGLSATFSPISISKLVLPIKIISLLLSYEF